MSYVASNLKQVQDRVRNAACKRPQHLQHGDPRLVAVSKTKGLEMIFDAYDAGQRHFGENYVKEFHEKANDIELLDRCDEIKWHFIGHLQRNKVTKVLDIPNLYMCETVDSERIAKALNDGWGRLDKTEPLRVMAQCNTSGEENKHGCAPEEMVGLTKYIIEECKNLHLAGLMTIGSYDFDCSKGPNPDFQSLIAVRENVCKTLGIPLENLELSMGMSADFEHAIDLGSSNIRVGSTIFGAREKPNSKVAAAVESEPSKDSLSSNESSANVFNLDSAMTGTSQLMEKVAIS